jgi:hypothetical protein
VSSSDTSALLVFPKAYIRKCGWLARFVQEADIAFRAKQSGAAVITIFGQSDTKRQHGLHDSAEKSA